MRYEYRVIASPERGARARGAKTGAERLAVALEELLAEQAAEGWEFQRAEVLPVMESAGTFSASREVQRAVLIFRRAIGDDQRSELVPPVARAETAAAASMSGDGRQPARREPEPPTLRQAETSAEEQRIDSEPFRLEAAMAAPGSHQPALPERPAETGYRDERVYEPEPRRRVVSPFPARPRPSTGSYTNPRPRDAYDPERTEPGAFASGPRVQPAALDKREPQAERAATAGSAPQGHDSTGPSYPSAHDEPTVGTAGRHRPADEPQRDLGDIREALRRLDR